MECKIFTPLLDQLTQTGLPKIHNHFTCALLSITAQPTTNIEHYIAQLNIIGHSCSGHVH